MRDDVRREIDRRRLLGAVAGGFALSASGFFLPVAEDTVAAREGAADGLLGGRRGQNRRGRERRREPGDNKENRPRGGAPGAGGNTMTLVLVFTNETQADVSTEIWLDAKPEGRGGWRRERGPVTTGPNGVEPYLAPTHGAGYWIGGSFGHFWVRFFIHGFDDHGEVDVRLDGEMMPGLGHQGGEQIAPFDARPAVNESVSWMARGYTVVVRRVGESGPRQGYSIRLLDSPA